MIATIDSIPKEAPPSYSSSEKPDVFPPSPPETVKESQHQSRRSSISIGTGSLEEIDSTTRPYPLPPSTRQNKVLPQDLKTPDSHVQRDPRLIRLTGIHPFNTEAPLSDLFDEGFINSKDLHYVRNHGAVPLVDDADMMDWEFTVEGMVKVPIRLTLRSLIHDFEQTTYPVTLVCAGNRRKEQNVVRKTKGFSWGAAGLSTALWTGVPLRDLIARASPKRGARYVYFEGADKLPNGHYGTSIKLNWAVDPNRGIMVAHRMNGEALHPDHGKPLRVVIPGQIGGRSVKWLKRIVVTSEPSDNWYHIYDNRVLPTMVTPEASADLPETWKDERYAIYDLNTNSATCYPAHNERVPLSGGADVYRFRGYAYAGGGKRVSRMEVTLDKGKSWRLANLRYPEDDYRDAPLGDTLYGGKVDLSWREACFCWCFWDLEVPMADLIAADDVMIRAMDDSMMVQPRDMYWSVLGMMNNPWYRVVIHKEGHDLRFEHPTQPALIPGGWMERVKKAGGDLANGFWGERRAGDEEELAVATEEPAKEICMTNPLVNRIITINELKQHDGEAQPWFVINGQVYDGTKYLDGHPGGATSIIGAAGQDCSEEFLAIHSENAKTMMSEYHIGSLDEKSQAMLAEPESMQTESTAPRPVFLQCKTWSKALLQEKTRVSADSKIFGFKLDHAEQEIGLPVGQHLMMRLRDPATREAIIRAYTPISDSALEKGILRVLIKIYYESAGEKGGKMTQALDHLPVGHWVDFKGPVGRFEYLGKGKCLVSGRERSVRRFIMICAGSGVTPIFQVFRAVIQDKEDPTTCLVLDGNRVEEDILCREELERLSAGNEDRCRVVHSLSKPSEEWTGAKGRLDRALIEKELGGAGVGKGQDMVLICGPESMETSVKQILTQDLGWKDEDLLFF